MPGLKQSHTQEKQDILSIMTALETQSAGRGSSLQPLKEKLQQIKATDNLEDVKKIFKDIILGIAKNYYDELVSVYSEKPGNSEKEAGKFIEDFLAPGQPGHIYPRLSEIFNKKELSLQDIKSAIIVLEEMKKTLAPTMSSQKKSGVYFQHAENTIKSKFKKPESKSDAGPRPTIP